ncbi:MAG: hypothetical protein ACREND_14465, partial [Gemmatimonadaceae bacterium]
MPDQPDDTQKQQRRSTALPPFFAPRTTRPTTPAQSGTGALPRRSSQLFTPPGVPKQPRPATPVATPLASRRVTPFAAPVIPAAPAPAPEPISFDPPAPPPIPAIEPDTPSAEAAYAMPEAKAPNEGQREPAAESSDAFVIERFESAPISLRPTGEQGVVRDESTMSFQVFDDASRLLARDDARPPQPDAGDAIEIERTEVTFEPAAESRLEVESFWAAEAPLDAADAAPLGTEPPAEPEVVERDTQPMLDAIEPAAQDIIRVPSWLEDAPPALPAPEPAEPSPAIEYAVPAPAPDPAPVASDDAEEALAEAFSEPAPNETVPRWATPRVNRAVEDDRPTQPNDGWNLAAPRPPDELTAALAWPDSGLRAPTPAS